VIGEGDKVVVRATNRCVQDSFFGVPAGGVEQVFTAMFIFQFADGLAIRTWRNAADLQRLLRWARGLSRRRRRRPASA